MSLINYDALTAGRERLYYIWNDPSKPFRYFVYDDIFHPDAAEEVLNEFPAPDIGDWNNTTYINQKNKFTMTRFSDGFPNIQRAFDELNSDRFLNLIEQITGIKDLQGDDDLFGGGLHQSVKGAFLDVHVDFNLHEKTRQHRRMNAIVFLNKDWKEEYNGCLELWDMSDARHPRQIEHIEPKFNRCVVFETNEVSFHGHPKPLNTPKGVSRKSLAVYYYTKERPIEEIAEEHNTIYVNTEGAKGKVKNIRSGVKALLERVSRKATFGK